MVARAPSSRSKLLAATIHELAARPEAAVLLDFAGTVMFANEAWERLGRVGAGLAGATVGAGLLDGIEGDRPREVMRQVLERAVHGGGRPRTLTCECNAPDLARLVTLSFTPVPAGADPIGLTVVRKVVRALPVAEVYPVVHGSADDYRAGDGMLEQCTCCGRTRRPGEPGEWDFVPSLVVAPPRDTLFDWCPLCRELHDPLGGAG